MNGLKEYLSQLGGRRLAFMGAGVAVILAALLVGVIYLRTPEYALLRSNVDPADMQAITEKLTQAGITYKLANGGTTIMAAADQVDEASMSLAAAHIGGGIGNELLDKQSMLGSTSQQQRENFRRALEGELSRTIKSIKTVRSARVHIVMPERELFAQEKREPSAAVTLTTSGRLPSETVNAIRYLVSSSVPDMQPGRISIIDQNGTLLARADNGDGSGLMGTLNERQAALETQMRQKIMTMLEQVVGVGRVDAKVSIELDSEQVRSEADLYNPDLQVVARSTTVERNDKNNSSEPGGEVTVSRALPEEESVSSSTTTSASSAETSEQVDYANSKTRTTTIRESGSIKRMTVAVVVDGKYTKAANGSMTYAARSPGEIEQLSALVKSAIGYSEDRNDEVTVTNMRFVPADTGVAANDHDLPFGLTGSDVTKLVQTLILAGLGLLALLFVARPLIRNRGMNAGQGADASMGTPQLGGPEARLGLPAPDEETALLLERAAKGDEEALMLLQHKRDIAEGRANLEAEIDIAQIQGRIKAAAMKKVGDVVERHPEEAAAVVRKWMQA